MLDKLQVPKSQIFVWAFIPYRVKEQDLISEFYDLPEFSQQLTDVFAKLGLKWIWQPITFENMHSVVEQVSRSSNNIPVVLNYCDGTEIDGYPGVSVVKLLESKGIIFTGANSHFFNLCDSKILMKRAFVEHDVATAAYEVITDINHVQGVCDRLGTPLIVKPAISLESRGISLDSVAYSDRQISLQIQRLLQGQHEMQFRLGDIFVERFINGREFTVFIVGSSHQPDRLKIYPPMERVFNSSVPETERFLSYGYWERDDEESFLSFQLVDSDLHERLCDLSKRAYCAVDGNGYGRVDIRMDRVSSELFVLEVNPNCGISSQSLSNFSDSTGTSVGTILHLAGIPFVDLMSEIIAEALTEHYPKLQLRTLSDYLTVK
jgi:D-alanine-D-alanine ligase